MLILSSVDKSFIQEVPEDKMHVKYQVSRNLCPIVFAVVTCSFSTYTFTGEPREERDMLGKHRSTIHCSICNLVTPLAL